MTNDPKLDGCIVLVRGDTFLSKQIILHMRILAKMTGRKPLPYSHAEFLLWDNVTRLLWTVGARESGTEISLVQGYYQGKDIMILRPVVPLTSHENAKLWDYFRAVDKAKYQYSNFISWINYIKTFGLVWLSPKGTHRNYCYELAARFANQVGRWSGPSLDRVSIYDLVENVNYKM